MHALEFLLNGKQVCIAAPGDEGLVMSHVAMAGSLDTPSQCETHLRIGGVRDEQHLEWRRQLLKVGDTVEIRVIDAAQSDPPIRVEPISNDQRERLRIASGGTGR